MALSIVQFLGRKLQYFDQKTTGNQHCERSKRIFLYFSLLSSSVFCSRTDFAYWELYEGPGGNLVDGLPPAPSRSPGFSRRAR
eukprot:2291636-Pyramimonas_sp.AAC.1